MGDCCKSPGEGRYWGTVGGHGEREVRARGTVCRGRVGSGREALQLSEGASLDMEQYCGKSP